MSTLTPQLLLNAYSQGYFPMADPEEGGRIYWYAPDPRALLPLDDRFHLSRNLRKLIRRQPLQITTDRAFEAVIRACARPQPDRSSTWISEEVVHAYLRLHEAGHAHSIECWAGSRLAGGLYGVALGEAFFGESMFQERTDASKIALAHLVDRLRAGGFTLLDIQFMTEHLARFGAYEVSRVRYERLLRKAVSAPANWNAIDAIERGTPPAASSGGTSNI